MPLSDIVSVTISTQNPGVTQAGFGVPLILSQTVAWVERSRVYTDIDGVVADVAATTPEYAAANKIFSQTPRPTTHSLSSRASAITSSSPATSESSKNGIQNRASYSPAGKECIFYLPDAKDWTVVCRII